MVEIYLLGMFVIVILTIVANVLRKPEYYNKIEAVTSAWILLITWPMVLAFIIILVIYYLLAHILYKIHNK